MHIINVPAYESQAEVNLVADALQDTVEHGLAEDGVGTLAHHS